MALRCLGHGAAGSGLFNHPNEQIIGEQRGIAWTDRDGSGTYRLGPDQAGFYTCQWPVGIAWHVMNNRQSILAGKGLGFGRRSSIDRNNRTTRLQAPGRSDQERDAIKQGGSLFSAEPTRMAASDNDAGNEAWSERRSAHVSD